MQDVTKDRNKYIGGSDIPIIMGISPFKTRYDLLLEKAGLKENDFTGNEYTEYGNELEPKIRDYINKTDNYGSFKEYKKINGDIRCHLDGYNGIEVLEIKTTSQIHDNINDYKTYLVQLLFYMQEVGSLIGFLAVYERPKDFNIEFNKDRLNIYGILIDDYTELLEQINKAVDQFRIDLLKVKDNPLITEEELLPVNINELSTKVIEFEEQLSKMKEIEKQAKDFKQQLKSAMEKSGLKKWTTTNGTQITLVADSPDKDIEVEYINEDKFIADNFELNEKYHNKLSEYKETKIETKKGRTGYVKITLSKES